MDKVMRIINFFRGTSSTQHPLFRQLVADSEDATHDDLLLHNDVRWLSKGKALDRFCALLGEVKAFLISSNSKAAADHLVFLEDKKFLSIVAFLADIFGHLNNLNMQLQGKDKTIVDMVEKLQAFTIKLGLLESDISTGRLLHFSTLKTQARQVTGLMVDFIKQLRANFSSSVIPYCCAFSPWSSRMRLHFCPQCGTKLQPGFKFCPSCGEKLPCVADLTATVEATSSEGSQLLVTDGVISTPANISTLATGTSQLTIGDSGGLICSSTSPVSARTPLRRTRQSTPMAKNEESPSSLATPPVTTSPKCAADLSPKSVITPRKRRAVTPKVEKINEEPSVELASPLSSPLPRSPSTVKGKAKKAKRVCAVEPLQEGEDLSDTTGRKWRLVKLLSQSEAELFYGVQQCELSAKTSDYKYILKLGAKDGKIFNEQNFLQRAAKPSLVEKWIKQAKMDFLGVPSCVGFGLHSNTYRFLIFPNMGQTLQSFMDEGDVLLSEKAVLQLGCRILDVLEFIHKNEYVHADIHAENIYISRAQQTQVYLAGYGHAFRYCPGGRHVEYREGSRASHEGAMEFISMESHKGAGPSRRSDLQALGYCLLRWHTGTLPWSSLTHTPARVSAEKDRFMKDIPGLMSHCFGQKKVSGALQSYLSQVMALQYSDQPDYKALRAGLLVSLQMLGGSLEKPVDLQI
ncbi:hypothetical protein DPEC_G00347950 [Dallia pectoralis]|uniref:Uncharacterized protein n=1 Tax=Dallia pectoralis TaxID=75939 RepID=A0ACC2F4C4_DALPE|nr:hypothetical protein DPEC_G00347950 [Dallia pectoralis]